MNYSLPPRLILTVLLAGVLANFIDYDVGDQMIDTSYSSWRTLEAEPMDLKPDLVRVGSVFGVTSGAESSPSTQPKHANGDTHQFTFDGITYRLSGLVVQGDLSSATLIGQDGEAVRVGVGAAIPGGEKIVSISLDELVLLREDGSIEAVVIYKR